MSRTTAPPPPAAPAMSPIDDPPAAGAGAGPVWVDDVGALLTACETVADAALAVATVTVAPFSTVTPKAVDASDTEPRLDEIVKETRDALCPADGVMVAYSCSASGKGDREAGDSRQAKKQEQQEGGHQG